VGDESSHAARMFMRSKGLGVDEGLDIHEESTFPMTYDCIWCTGEGTFTWRI
jgi:hypothetical protein